MTMYLLTYDNHAPRNYDRLYQLMATWKAVSLAESVWLANLNGSADVVRDNVKATLQPDDLIAVIELTRDSKWATLNASTAANGWLSHNILPSKKAA